MDRRVSCLGLCQGVARAALTVGSEGAVLTYGYQMVDVKKTKEKKPVREFPPAIHGHDHHTCAASAPHPGASLELHSLAL